MLMATIKPRLLFSYVVFSVLRNVQIRRGGSSVKIGET